MTVPDGPATRSWRTTSNSFRGLVVEVDQPCAPAAGFATLRVTALDLDAVGEHCVEPTAILDQCRVRWAREDPYDVFDGIVRQIGIQAM